MEHETRLSLSAQLMMEREIHGRRQSPASSTFIRPASLIVLLEPVTVLPRNMGYLQGQQRSTKRGKQLQAAHST
jgi:hypothetical protein